MAIFTSRGVHVNCTIMAMLHTHSIGNQLYNTIVVFKMRDVVPSERYSPVCNVLRLWRMWLIPTYRVYRLYDFINPRCACAERVTVVVSCVCMYVCMYVCMSVRTRYSGSTRN